MSNKARTASNSAWGLMKRTKINTLHRRVYVLYVIGKSGCIYGIEEWGWAHYDTVMRMQNRYIKMAMGMAINTPAYIWRIEAGSCSYPL